MVRTKADNCSKKAVAAKAPRKILGSSSNSCASSSSLSSPSSGKVGKYAGGNSVCDRPTPEWQKGISAFLKKLPEKENKTYETNEEKEDQVECEPFEAVADEASSETSAASSSAGKGTSQRRGKNGIISSDEED